MTTASLVFLTRDALHSPVWSYGVLVGVYGTGMVLGPAVFLGRIRVTENPLRTWRLAQALFGVGAVTLGVARWLSTAFASQALSGAGNGIGNVATDLVVQTATPEHMLGTVSGVTMSIPFAASSLAYLVAAPLLGALGPRWVIVISGTGVLLVVLLMTALRPAVRSTRPPSSTRSPN